MKFIDPRIDFAFKKIFGSEDAKDILISFLESLLGLEGERRIAELTILDPFQAPKIKDLKYSVLDVKCRDHRDIVYIVEMQIQKTAALLRRIQYNAAKAYVHQIESGEEYPKLNQVIAITITDFSLFEGFEHCVSRHETRETVTGQSHLQEILYYFIELPKFIKPLEELVDILDQWLYFLKFAGSLEAIPEWMRGEPIRHAFEKARVANMTLEEYEYYEKAGMAITDARGVVQVAREEGHRAGREEGLQAGREEGLQAGREEGLQAGLRAGAQRILLRLIAQRFGPAPDWVQDRVTQAGLETLERWTEAALEARSVEAVFRQEGST